MTNYNKFTIGIITQPTSDAGQYANYGNQYVAGGYVKWIEMAGVQAFYIPWDSSEEKIKHYLKLANGFLFPGGPQKNTLPPSKYFQKIKEIYDLVIATNKQGTYFPLMGICQGFEQLIWSATNFGKELCIPTPDNPNKCVNDTSNVLLSCDFFPNGDKARMLNNSGIQALDETVKSTLQTPITPNFHSNAVFPISFRAGSPLGDVFNIIATSQKEDGPPFVSMIEGKTLPIYGLQWHTSLQVFEWSPKLSCLTHTPEAVLVMQYLANFLASELRKNNNQFGPIEFENIKFSKLPVVYAENLEHGPIFENTYFFGPPVHQKKRNGFLKFILWVFDKLKIR